MTFLARPFTLLFQLKRLTAASVLVITSYNMAPTKSSAVSISPALPKAKEHGSVLASLKSSVTLHALPRSHPLTPPARYSTPKPSSAYSNLKGGQKLRRRVPSGSVLSKSPSGSPSSKAASGPTPPLQQPRCRTTTSLPSPRKSASLH